jgi:hypothetical protein
MALDAVGLKLADVEGQPFWTTFWWQVSEDANQGIKEHDCPRRGRRVRPMGHAALCERRWLGHDHH